MAAIAPQTDVYLLKVPLEIDNTNQLTFANATAQFNYFNSLPKIGYDNFTYQRKDGVLRIPALIDDIIQYNYVMYRNEGFSNKWFYAYIDKMEYISGGMTAVSIVTDVWQTWQFDLTYKTTFIEREHVNDDTVGAHTIAEGLECGEYVINSTQTLKPDKTVKDHDNQTIGWYYPIVFQTTELVSPFTGINTYQSEYNGIFSGLFYFATISIGGARWVLEQYANAGKSDSVVAIFLAPKEFFNGAYKYTPAGTSVNLYVPNDTVTTSELLPTTTISRPTKVNGYTPKNNKLFCYPFSYLYVTNNAGIDTDFRYEDFKNATPKFYMAGALGQGCNTKLCPVDYKSNDNMETFEYGITGAKYPICAWSSDYYTNWMTQNAVNVGLGLTSSILSMGANAISGNVTGTANSLLSGVGGVMNQIYQAKIHPDQARGNTSCGDLLIPWQRYFTVDCMSVRSEVAQSIDKFFSMFGYKVNTVKTPNITGRRNWNYVKTIGCYIEADIPQEDLQSIKDMFNNGVTFWHNSSTFGDYNQNNDII